MSRLFLTVASGAVLVLLATGAPTFAAAQDATQKRTLQVASADSHGKEHHRHYRKHRRGGYGFSCGPRAQKRGQRLISLVEDVFTLKADQKAQLDNLKKAMADGRAEVKKVCDSLPTKAQNKKDKKSDKMKISFSQRLEIRERLMTAQLASLKKFRPAFEDFYNSLDAKQKRGLDRILNHRRHRRHR